MARCVVVEAHTIRDGPAIVIAPGDRVQVGERATEWPAFVFVTTRSGDGWVPVRYLSDASGTATVHTAYDTTELPTVVGEELGVIDRDVESGWTWCRNASGREGWVPDRTLSFR